MKKVLIIMMFCVVCLGVLVACSNDPSKITLEEFNQIEEFMTYDEVVEIIGGEGKLTGSTSVCGYEASIYEWDGKGSRLAKATLTFGGDKLLLKSQVGLK